MRRATGAGLLALLALAAAGPASGASGARPADGAGPAGHTRGAGPAGRTSGANVYIVDNAFVRDVQRPTVRIALGQRVTWHWRSRQSHSVSVRSGPVHFATRTRNHGSISHRFRTAGTYRFECSLHAPGMKMSVIVSRAR